MNYKQLGSRVREMRRKKRLTQEELAELAGISFAFVGHIERGTRKMSVETLLALAQALDCSADYLLDNLRAPSDDYQLALRRVAEFVQQEIENRQRQ